MSTINITANQNSDTHVTLTDAAAGGTKHLIQFFTDGKNVFNLGNGAMVPVNQITITPGVQYEFDITKEQALLLDGAASSYKHFLADEEPAVLQNEGTITVTVASGGALPSTVAFVNGDRRATKAADYTLTKDDDVIYANPAVSTEIVLTLPNETTMPGKRYEIKNIGAGTVSILDNDGVTEIINLNVTDASCHIKSNGSAGWELFYV